MKKIIFILILLFPIQGYSATYYVATTGNNGNSGADGDEWLTIQYAVDTVSANDTIIVKAGTYVEDVTITTNGITVRGVLDSNGDRLSIVSPYVDISGSWIHQGSGIYYQDLAYKVLGMLIEVGGVMYKVPRLCTEDDNAQSTRCSDYYDDLGWASDDEDPDGEHGMAGPLNRWDTVNIMFASDADGDTYISFQYDDAPDSVGDVYASTDGNDTFYITASDVTIENLEIRAKLHGIRSSGNRLTINNNKIIYGRMKIKLIEPSLDVVISNNEMTNFTYHDGYIQNNSPNGETYYIGGAWTSARASIPPGQTEAQLYATKMKNWNYLFSKYHSTDNAGARENQAIWAFESDGLTIRDNYIHDIDDGISTGSSDNIYIYGNTFTRLGSFSIATNESGETVYIYDNVFNDVNFAVRLQGWNRSESANREHYIYNNKMWNPIGYGKHIFMHYYPTPDVITYPASAWIYHNSMSGGVSGINNSSEAATSTPSGMEEVNMVNNVISSHFVVWDDGSGATMGICSYSWLGIDKMSDCLEATNYRNTSRMTGWDTPTMHNFDISGTDALGGGIDISSAFEAGGTSWPNALPGFNPGYFSGSNPDMGVIDRGSSCDSDQSPPVCSNSSFTTCTKKAGETYSQIELVWTACTDAPCTMSHYNVYRGTSANPTHTAGNLVDDCTSVSGLTCTDVGLDDNTTYYYSLEGVDSKGNVSTANVVVCNETTDEIPEPTPVYFKHTSATVTVDGVATEYSEATPFPVAWTVGDNTMTAKALWSNSANALYITITALDSDLEASSVSRDAAGVYQADSCEIFISSDGDRGAGYDVDDYHFICNIADSIYDANMSGCPGSCAEDSLFTAANFDCKTNYTGTIDGVANDIGYTMEFEIVDSDLTTGSTPTWADNNVIYIGFACTDYDNTSKTGSKMYDTVLEAVWQVPNNWSSVTLSPETSDNTPPPAPVMGSFGTITSTSIVVNWTNSDDSATGGSSITECNLYRDGDYNTAIYTGLAGTKTDNRGGSGLATGTQYQYNVTCTDSAGNVSNPSADATATTLSTSESLDYKWTPTPITIDGTIDSEWSAADSITISPSAGGNTATIKALWDNTNLYLSFAVTDTDLRKYGTDTLESEAPYMDNVAVFINLGSDGSECTDSEATCLNEFAFILRLTASGVFADQSSSSSNSAIIDDDYNVGNDVSYFVNETGTFDDASADTGYDVEMAIPWSALGNSAISWGQTVYISYSVTDVDDGTNNSELFGGYTTFYYNTGKWPDSTLIAPATAAW